MNIRRFVEYGGREISLEEAMLLCAFAQKVEMGDLISPPKSGILESLEAIENDPGILRQALDIFDGG